MARLYVDTAELRDLSTRTQHRANEVRSITDDAHRELRGLVNARGAPRFDIGSAFAHANNARNTAGGVAWAMEQESSDLRRVAGQVEASQSGSAFGRGLSLASSLFSAGSAPGGSALLLLGGATILPFVRASGLGGITSVAAGLGTIGGQHLRSAGTMPTPLSKNPIAALSRILRSNRGSTRSAWDAGAGFLRYLGSTAARLLGQVQVIALDAWAAIWRTASDALRQVRTGLSQVVGAAATAWNHAGPVVCRAGRWVVDGGRAITRWLTNGSRADLGVLGVFLGTLVKNPTELAALWQRPDGYRDLTDPRVAKGTTHEEETWSETLGAELTVLATVGSEVKFEGKRIRGADGTTWWEVDIEQEVGLGFGVGAGAKAKAGSAAGGARGSGDLTGAQTHRVTYRFSSKAEAQRFIDGVRTRYLREIWKAIAPVAFPGAALPAMFIPRQSVFDIARSLEGWPDEDADTYELSAKAKGVAKASGTFAEVGVEQAHAIEVSEGNEKFSTELKASSAIGLGLFGLSASGAGETTAKISIDPGDPTRLTATIKTKLTNDLEAALAPGKLSKAQVSQLKAAIKASGGVGTESRYRIDASVSRAQAARIQDALQAGDFTSAKRLLTAAGAGTKVTVEIWGVEDTSMEVGFQGAAGVKVGVEAKGSDAAARCLARTVFTL